MAQSSRSRLRLHVQKISFFSKFTYSTRTFTTLPTGNISFMCVVEGSSDMCSLGMRPFNYASIRGLMRTCVPIDTITEFAVTFSTVAFTSLPGFASSSVITSVVRMDGAVAAYALGTLSGICTRTMSSIRS